MSAVIRLAAAYWIGIFALGFVLGAIRIFVIVPMVGEFLAVLIELPVILTASWLWAGQLLRGHSLTPRQALAMGVLAFALLMASELALATLAFGQTPGEWLASLRHPRGQLGLVGQGAFGLFPWLRRLLESPAG